MSSKYLVVRDDCFVGTASEGALFQVAIDDDAPGGYVCRSVNPFDGEPEDVTKEEIESNDEKVFARVESVTEYDSWQEAVEAANAYLYNESA